MSSKLNSEENTINISMELIGIAGESRGYAMKALKEAKNGNIEEAEKTYSIAKQKINNAHKIHADIIFAEAQGNSIYINTLFIHAQDHFANALVTIDLLEYIIDLYKGK